MMLEGILTNTVTCTKARERARSIVQVFSYGGAYHVRIANLQLRISSDGEIEKQRNNWLILDSS
jgi:hypothetical protein